MFKHLEGFIFYQLIFINVPKDVTVEAAERSNVIFKLVAEDGVCIYTRFTGADVAPVPLASTIPLSDVVILILPS